jgi:hypothetical protein
MAGDVGVAEHHGLGVELGKPVLDGIADAGEAIIRPPSSAGR